MRAAKWTLGIVAIALAAWAWLRWRNRWRTLTFLHSDWAGRRHLFDTPWGYVWFKVEPGDKVVHINERYELGQRLQPNGRFEVYMNHIDPNDPVMLEVYAFDYENRTMIPTVRYADAMLA